MKTLHHAVIAMVLLCGFRAGAQTYTNFIRQTQYPSLIQWDASVVSSGTQASSLAIEPGGANFGLWTVATSGTTVTSYNLNNVFVASFIPVASVTITSEDTSSSAIPRTRCDRPFYVNYNITGLLASGTGIPAAATSVNLLHYVQSYGTGGTGIGIDRTQATLLTQASITTNGSQNLTFAITAIPGSNRANISGEETFSIFSLADTDCSAPSSQLASQYIQIWPIPTGTITGITNGQVIRMLLPQVTLTINEIYPNSQIYAQAYQGNPVLGTTGHVVPGSSLIVQNSVPQNSVMVLNNYSSVFTADGLWTMELLSKSPFGIDRLAYVTFTLNRTINMNGTITTSE